MTDDTISPLRRRMIEDMTVRGFSACTQRGYIAAVRRFTVFLSRSPDQATAEDLRRFQLQMRVEGASSTAMSAVHEVHGPALVRPLRHKQRHAYRRRCLRPMTADLQAFFDVQPAQLLVVQLHAFARQQHVQLAPAEAPPHRRPARAVASAPRYRRTDDSDSNRGPIDADHTTRPPLTHFMHLAQVRHGLPPGDGRHHSSKRCPPAARAVAGFMCRYGASVGAFVEARRRGNQELVILDVLTGVPQRPV